MTAMKVNSAAYNHSPLTSSVNMRTGGVDISIPLASISSGVQSPASFSLRLLSKAGRIGLDVHGFGNNWSLNVPRIDVASKLIYLSNGTAEKYDPTTFKFVYHKLEDYCIERLVNPGPNPTVIYMITHKSGTVEYLDHRGQITKMVSAGGHRLNFVYEDSGANLRTLKEINDGLSAKITIQYPEYAETTPESTIIIKEDTGSGVKIVKVKLKRLNSDFYALDSVSLPNNDLLTTRLEYTTQNDQVWVKKITTPNGQVQEFTYGSIPCSSTDTTPVVTKLEIMGEHHSATDEKKTVRYEYSARNFTGYKHDEVMLPDQDNCILLTDDYTYSVTEIHSDIRFIRQFNRFHLLVSEWTKEGNDTSEDGGILTRFKYPLISNVNIHNQPANYALWTELKTTYSNTLHESVSILRRDVIETREHDTQGNLLKQKLSNGMRIENTYYAPAGEPNKCPAVSHGFINYVKTSKLIPNDAPTNSAVKLSEWTYVAVQGLPHALPFGGTRASPMVLVKAEKKNGIEVKAYEYVETGTAAATNPVFVGLPTKETVGTLVTNYRYTLSGAQATIHTEQVSSATTNMGTGAVVVELKKGSAKVINLASGLVTQDVDYNGAVTNYQYDDLNRLVRQAEFADTANPQTETYAYDDYRFIDATYKYQNVVTITKPSGLKQINYVNFNNLLCYSLEQLTETSRPFCVRKICYNNADLITEDIEYDEVKLLGTPVEKCATKTKYTYALRQLVETEYANGTKQKNQKKLAFNIESSQFQNGPIYTTTFNDIGLPISTTVKEGARETLLESHEYDGFCRKIMMDHPTGERNEFSYNEDDRLTKKTISSADDNGRKDTVEYVYSSDIQNALLPVTLTNKTRQGVESTILVSTRKYDGFGRLTEQDNQRFSYDRPYYDTPSKAFCVGTEQSAYTLRTLNSATSQIDDVKIFTDGASTNAAYSYHRKTGWPISAITEKCLFNKNVNNHGSPTRISNQYTWGPDRTRASTLTENTYSASGKRMIKSVNHLRFDETNMFNAAGQLVSKHYNNIGLISIHYDTEGNISELNIASHKFSNNGPGKDHSLSSLTLDYNSANLEAQRRLKIYITPGTSTVALSVHNTYDDIARLTSRVIKKGDESSTLTQTYTYQAPYGQLETSTAKRGSTESVTHYQYAGGQRFSSCTETGKPQTVYTYDADRVSAIVQGSQNHTFTADARGNITGLPARIIRYNAANQIMRVANGSVTHDYFYDPSGRLSQITNESETVIYLYEGDELIGEICGDAKTLYLRIADITIGRYIVRGTEERLELFGTDATGTVRCVKTFAPGNVGESEVSTVYYDYSDYGVRTSTATGSVSSNTALIHRNTLGFNGCLFDSVSDSYILGNGYRAYSPELKTFLSPDSMSPFGAAGVNRYQYCNLDPINNIDPSGHLSYSAQWGIGLGIAGILLSVIPIVGAIAGGTLLTLAGGFAVAGGVLGVTSSALGIASALTEDNKELSTNLGYASLAFGIASMGAGAGASAAHSARSVVRHQARALEALTTARYSVRVNGGKLYGSLEYYAKNNMVVAEGGNFVTQTTGGWLDTGGQLANRIRPIIDSTRPVTLKSCYSAVGGRLSSQAQRLANALDVDVTGFTGLTKIDGSAGARTFHPQTGWLAARTAALNSIRSGGNKFYFYGIN